MKLANIFTALLLGVAAVASASQPKVVAHRGYWRAPGSAQNSLAAIAKADSIRCYGSEFDVWLSTDGDLFVNHDATFKGHVVEQSTSAELAAIVLDNGETMPTLDAYLAKAKTLKTRLVLELKEHKTQAQETEAVEKIVAMVKKYGLEKRTEYISFSLFACKEFKRLAPKGTKIYYLNGELAPAELKALGFAGLDYSYGTIQKHPEWIEEAHRLKLKVNIWTVDTRDKLQWLIDHKVDFITTNEPVLLQEMLKK